MPRSQSSVRSPVEVPSSPDPLANSSESGNTLHSIARPNRRLTSPRKTPLADGNVNSQIIPSSPQRAYFAANSPSKAITEQTLSPWKIRVTVEAEPEDGNGTPQYSTQTYQVPLKSCSSPTRPNAARGRGRAGQSSPVRKKRSGTPVRAAGNRRKSVTNLDITVLGDDEDEDEWSPQKKSQVKKRGRRQSKPTKEIQPSSPEPAQSIEEDADMYGPGTLIPRSISPEPAPQVEEDANMYDGVSPSNSSQSSTAELREIDTNRVSVRPRSHSAKRMESESHHERRQQHLDQHHPGRQKSKAPDFSNISAISYPTPSPTPSAPGDEEFDEDEGVGYDTVMESEGFTMIDLESIPSAKRFLSSPQELAGHSPGHERESEVPSSTEEAQPLHTTMPITMPIHVTNAADETELSSNVASSPPQATDMLQIQPQRPSIHRKVTPNPYASPELPPPPTQTKKPVSPDTEILPPKRVVNAGKALYGALSNSEERRLDQKQSPSAGSEDFLDGFSSGTKRELRAHLRLGEELAKEASYSKPQRSGLAERSDQVWRGEALVHRSPFALAHSRKKSGQDANGDGSRWLGSSLLPGSYKDSGCLNQNSAQKPVVSQSETVRGPAELKAFQNEHVEDEWKGREDALQYDPTVGRVEAMLDEPTEDASEEDDRAAGDSFSSKRATESNRRGERASSGRGELDGEGKLAARSISSIRKDMPDATKQIAGGEPEILSIGDETDIWLLEAQESSSSPAIATKKATENVAKPRRRLIPSPWKRGEDVPEASTMLSNGDMSGMLWQQPQDTRFGAGELARQTKRASSNNFDLQRMLSSPVKLATVGRNNLKFRTQHGQVSSSSSSSSAAEPFISEDSAQSALEEETSSLTKECDSRNDSSIPSSPPQPENIPVNFGDRVADVEDVTPPPLKRSCPTDSDQRRPPTPRSAMKGGRRDVSPVKQVVFNDRSRYLNDLGEESTMSANLDSPAPTPAQPYRAPAPSETNSEESLLETPQANGAKSGWATWFLRGQNGSSDGRSESASDESQAQSSVVSSGSSDPASRTSHHQTSVDDESGADWQETRVGVHASQRRPIAQSSATASKAKKVSLSRLPSYLQPPSYPSLKPSDPAYTPHPLATSGDFTNAHFRTLHILHAKSTRPRFHAPKHVRPEVQSLRGMKLTVDESEAGMDIFEWTVGMEECLVIERFMQEVEWGWVQSWYDGQAEEALRAKMTNAGHGGERDLKGGVSVWTAEMCKVGWGWTPEEIARHFGMVVIGEVVRGEEREREREL